MKCYRAQVRHKNKLHKIIKKDRMMTVLFCLLWSINNFSNAASIIHLYIPKTFIYQRPKTCCFLASFIVSPHPCAWWHLCFLRPCPPSLIKPSCASPSPLWCQKLGSDEGDGQHATGFSIAKILLELRLELCHVWQASPAFSICQHGSKGSIWK